jgi:CubicO group peptidase (beta-lactamase class C family)
VKTSILLFTCVVLAIRAQAAVKSGDVDALFRAFDRATVPGASVMVIRDGKVLYKHAYGLADVEGHVSAGTGTNYRLASVTKQFTAMAILMLAERKRLSLDLHSL